MTISRSVLRNTVVALSCLASGYAFAGGPDVAPAAPASFVYLGAGFNYIKPSVRGSVVESSAAANFNSSLSEPFAPHFQAGFLTPFGSNFLMGAKFEYDYVGASYTHSSAVANPHQINVNGDNFLNLLFQAGVQITPSSDLLVGFGANTFDVTLDALNTTTGASSADKTRWRAGFTGALDYLYHFSDAFFADVGYQYSYDYVNYKETVGASGSSVDIYVPRSQAQQILASFNAKFSV